MRTVLFAVIAGVALAAPPALLGPSALARQGARPAAPASGDPVLLEVDATQAPRRVFRSTMIFPAKPGPMALTYPKWIPGEHAPTGPIADVVGVRISVGGKPIPWRRDLTDMHAFVFDVPAGAKSVTASMEYVAGGGAAAFTAGGLASSSLAVVDWHLMLLAPRGAAADSVVYSATLKLPAGWQFGTALPGAQRSGDVVAFAPAPLRTLVDSPVVCGKHFRRFDLTPGQNPPHTVETVADSPQALEMPAERLEAHKRIIAEALALFGARHYRGYSFLLTLSDAVSHFGLEHHESSDDRAHERSLVDDDAFFLYAGLLPHEYVHSWCGKFRRPAGLATPDYETPMKGDMLWVYEGLTTYLGQVLSARSGMLTPEEYREGLAATAAAMDSRSGREWRSLQDTADAAQILYESSPAWSNWRRATDFYPEMELVWLEVDTMIRALSAKAGAPRTLDDFCRSFFAAEPGKPRAENDASGRAPSVSTYTAEDVWAALGAVAEYPWKDFLDERLTAVGSARGPLDGLLRSGWKVEYTEEPNARIKAADGRDKTFTLLYSLGAVFGEEGEVRDVVVGGPAARAGLAPGMKVVALRGRKFGKEAVADALAQAKADGKPIECIVENAERYLTIGVEYTGGARWPHLVRDEARPDMLGEIIRPKTWDPKTPGAAGKAPKKR